MEWDTLNRDRLETKTEHLRPLPALRNALHAESTAAKTPCIPNMLHPQTLQIKYEAKLGQVSEFVTFQPLKILLLEQDVDAFFNILHSWREAAFDLLDSFRNELLMLHLLAGFHDTYNSRLLKN
jgi:hypothetical protein